MSLLDELSQEAKTLRDTAHQNLERLLAPGQGLTAEEQARFHQEFAESTKARLFDRINAGRQASGQSYERVTHTGQFSTEELQQAVGLLRESQKDPLVALSTLGYQRGAERETGRAFVAGLRQRIASSFQQQMAAKGVYEPYAQSQNLYIGQHGSSFQPEDIGRIRHMQAILGGRQPVNSTQMELEHRQLLAFGAELLQQAKFNPDLANKVNLESIERQTVTWAGGHPYFRVKSASDQPGQRFSQLLGVQSAFVNGQPTAQVAKLGSYAMTPTLSVNQRTGQVETSFQRPDETALQYTARIALEHFSAGNPLRRFASAVNRSKEEGGSSETIQLGHNTTVTPAGIAHFAHMAIVPPSIHITSESLSQTVNAQSLRERLAAVIEEGNTTILSQMREGREKDKMRRFLSVGAGANNLKPKHIDMLIGLPGIQAADTADYAALGYDEDQLARMVHPSHAKLGSFSPEEQALLRNSVTRQAILDPRTSHVISGHQLAEAGFYTRSDQPGAVIQPGFAEGIFRQGDILFGGMGKAAKKSTLSTRPKSTFARQNKLGDWEQVEPTTFESPFKGQPAMTGVPLTMSIAFGLHLPEGQGLVRPELGATKSYSKTLVTPFLSENEQAELYALTEQEFKRGDRLKFGQYQALMNVSTPGGRITGINIQPQNTQLPGGTVLQRHKVTFTIQGSAEGAVAADFLGFKANLARSSIPEQLGADLVVSGPSQAQAVALGVMGLLSQKERRQNLASYLQGVPRGQKAAQKRAYEAFAAGNITAESQAAFNNVYTHYLMTHGEEATVNRTFTTAQILQMGAYPHLPEHYQHVVQRELGLTEKSHPDMAYKVGDHPATWQGISLVPDSRDNSGQSLWSVQERVIQTRVQVPALFTSLGYNTRGARLPIGMATSATENVQNLKLRGQLGDYFRSLGAKERRASALDLAIAGANAGSESMPMRYQQASHINIQPGKAELWWQEKDEQGQAVTRTTDIRPEDIRGLSQLSPQDFFSGLNQLARQYGASAPHYMQINGSYVAGPRALAQRTRSAIETGFGETTFSKLATSIADTLSGQQNEALPRIIQELDKDVDRRKRGIYSAMSPVGATMYVIGEHSLHPHESALHTEDAIDIVMAEATRQGYNLSRADAGALIEQHETQHGFAFASSQYRYPHIQRESAQLVNILTNKSLQQRGASVLASRGQVVTNVLTEMLGAGDFDKDTNALIGAFINFQTDESGKLVGYSSYSGIEKQILSTIAQKVQLTPFNPAGEYRGTQTKWWLEDSEETKQAALKAFRPGQSATELIESRAGLIQSYWQYQLKQYQVNPTVQQFAERTNVANMQSKLHMRLEYSAAQRFGEGYLLSLAHQLGTSDEVKSGVLNDVNTLIKAAYQQSLDLKNPDRGISAFAGLTAVMSDKVYSYESMTPIRRLQEFMLMTGQTKEGEAPAQPGLERQLANWIVPLDAENRKAAVEKFASILGQKRSEYWAKHQTSQQDRSFVDEISKAYNQSFGGNILTGHNVVSGILAPLADALGRFERASIPPSERGLIQRSPLMNLLEKSKRISNLLGRAKMGAENTIAAASEFGEVNTLSVIAQSARQLFNPMARAPLRRSTVETPSALTQKEAEVMFQQSGMKLKPGMGFTGGMIAETPDGKEVAFSTKQEAIAWLKANGASIQQEHASALAELNPVVGVMLPSAAETESEAALQTAEQRAEAKYGPYLPANPPDKPTDYYANIVNKVNRQFGGGGTGPPQKPPAPPSGDGGDNFDDFRRSFRYVPINREPDLDYFAAPGEKPQEAVSVNSSLTRAGIENEMLKRGSFSPAAGLVQRLVNATTAGGKPISPLAERIGRSVFGLQGTARSDIQSGQFGRASGYSVVGNPGVAFVGESGISTFNLAFRPDVEFGEPGGALGHMRRVSAEQNEGFEEAYLAKQGLQMLASTAGGGEGLPSEAIRRIQAAIPIGKFRAQLEHITGQQMPGIFSTNAEGQTTGFAASSASLYSMFGPGGTHHDAFQMVLSNLRSSGDMQTETYTLADPAIQAAVKSAVARSEPHMAALKEAVQVVKNQNWDQLVQAGANPNTLMGAQMGASFKSDQAQSQFRNLVLGQLGVTPPEQPPETPGGQPPSQPPEGTPPSGEIPSAGSSNTPSQFEPIEPTKGYHVTSASLFSRAMQERAQKISGDIGSTVGEALNQARAVLPQNKSEWAAKRFTPQEVQTMGEMRSYAKGYADTVAIAQRHLAAYPDIQSALSKGIAGLPLSESGVSPEGVRNVLKSVQEQFAGTLGTRPALEQSLRMVASDYGRGTFNTATGTVTPLSTSAGQMYQMLGGTGNPALQQTVDILNAGRDSKPLLQRAREVLDARTEVQLKNETNPERRQAIMAAYETEHQALRTPTARMADELKENRRQQARMGKLEDAQAVRQDVPALAARLGNISQVFETLTKSGLNLSQAQEQLIKTTGMSVSQIDAMHQAASKFVELTGLYEQQQPGKLGQIVPGTNMTYGQLSQQLRPFTGEAGAQIQANIGGMRYAPPTPTDFNNLSFLQHMALATAPGAEAGRMRAEATKQGAFGAPGSLERAAWQAYSLGTSAADLAVKGHYAYRNIAQAYFTPVTQGAIEYATQQRQFADNLAMGATTSIAGGTSTAQFQYANQMLNAMQAQQVGFNRQVYNTWGYAIGAGAGAGTGLFNQVASFALPVAGVYEATKFTVQELGQLGGGLGRLGLGGAASGVGTAAEEAVAAGSTAGGGAMLGGLGSLAAPIAAFAAAGALGVGLGSAFVGAGKDRQGLISTYLRAMANGGRGSIADALRIKAGEIFQPGGYNQMVMDFSAATSIVGEGAGVRPSTLQQYQDVAGVLYDSLQQRGGDAYQQQEQDITAFLMPQFGTATTGTAGGIGMTTVAANLLTAAQQGITVQQSAAFQQVVQASMMGAAGSISQTGAINATNLASVLQISNPAAVNSFNQLVAAPLMQAQGQLNQQGQSMTFGVPTILNRLEQPGFSLPSFMQNLNLSTQYATLANSDSYFARNRTSADFVGDLMGGGPQLATLMAGAQTPEQKNAISNAFVAAGDVSKQIEAQYGSAVADNMRAQFNSPYDVGAQNAAISFAGQFGLTQFAQNQNQPIAQALVQRQAAGFNLSADLTNLAAANAVQVGSSLFDQQQAAAGGYIEQINAAPTSAAGRMQFEAVTGARAQVNPLLAAVGAAMAGTDQFTKAFTSGNINALPQTIQAYQTIAQQQLQLGTSNIGNLLNLTTQGQGAIQLQNFQTAAPLMAAAQYGLAAPAQLAAVQSFIGNQPTAALGQFYTGVAQGNPIANALYAQQSGYYTFDAGNMIMRRQIQTGNRGGTKGAPVWYDENMNPALAATPADAQAMMIEQAQRTAQYSKMGFGAIQGGAYSTQQLTGMNTVQIQANMVQIEQQHAQFQHAQAVEQLGIAQQQFAIQYGAVGAPITPGLTSETGIQRAQQLFSYNIEGERLGVQGQQMVLSNEQFQTDWQVQRAQLGLSSSYQFQEMGITHQHQIQESQWQQADITFQQNMNAMQFGFSMIQSDEDIRYSRGRQRRDAMRQRQEQVLSYSMEMGQSNKEMQRAKQREQWDNEAYQRQVAYFQANLALQIQAMNNQKMFHDEAYALEQQSFALTVKEHQQQGVFMQAEFILQDKQKALQAEQLAMQQRQVEESYLYSQSIAQLQGILQSNNTLLQNMGTYENYLVQTGQWFTTNGPTLLQIVQGLLGLTTAGNTTPAPNILVPGSGAGATNPNSYGNSARRVGGLNSGVQMVHSPVMATLLQGILTELQGIHKDGGNAVVTINSGSPQAAVRSGLTLAERARKR